jgi:chromosome segregation ATPase
MAKEVKTGQQKLTWVKNTLISHSTVPEAKRAKAQGYEVTMTNLGSSIDDVDLQLVTLRQTLQEAQEGKDMPKVQEIELQISQKTLQKGILEKQWNDAGDQLFRTQREELHFVGRLEELRAEQQRLEQFIREEKANIPAFFF